MSGAALIIGAGTDELVAAHLLARAGRRVTVLDPRHEPGQAPPFPGWVPASVARELQLDQRGLRVEHADPWVSAPLAGGGRLELWHNTARSASSIRKLSPRDAERWPAFCASMSLLAGVLEEVYDAPPPAPLGGSPGDLTRLATLALRSRRRLGRRGVEDLMRLLPMPVADFLDDWFESDALKGVLGASGIMHLAQGPRSGGTAFCLLHHHVGAPPGVFRPALSNIGSVLAALPGVDMRHSTQVARIDVRNGRATGVTLASGEELASSLVLSGADPRLTLLQWVDAGWLDPELLRSVRGIRRRGVAARVTLGLDKAPGFASLALAPSLEYLERAHDDAKYGLVSREPYLEARSLGPEANGRHRVDVHFQHAPYSLAGAAWDGERRDALGEQAQKVFGELAPDLVDSVIERYVLSPVDLEREEGWPEGQAFHAELALDQWLWMRPIPALAHYRTPIEGLYLCGPATHPGAGIAGGSGRNAALQVLRDLKRMKVGE